MTSASTISQHLHHSFVAQSLLSDSAPAQLKSGLGFKVQNGSFLKPRMLAAETNSYFKDRQAPSKRKLSDLGTCLAKREVSARVAGSDLEDQKVANGSTNQNPGFERSDSNIALIEEAEEVEREHVSNIGSSRTEQSTVTREGSSRPKRFVFDYGFQAKFLRKGPTVPRNVFKLAFENFGREWRALRRSYLFRKLDTIDISKVEGGPLGIASVYLGRALILFLRGTDKLLQVYDGLPELKQEEVETNKEIEELQQALKKLTLSNDAVWERESNRPPVEAPWWILGPYYVLCTMLDVIFKDRPIQRFWFLETVARMPYFSYISMLHLYETLGWWRVGAEVRKVHFAEEWNEMHHLKIMESLGGDLEWGDRFFAQHAAFFYYWILNLMFLVSPKVAYNFSELIEMHAVDTYGEFVDENEELLKRLPPPPVAVEYYESEDLYMYDDFQTSQLPETRRPKVDSLYDVFSAIAGDEYEHVKTMVACQQLDTVVVSPHKAKVKGRKLHD